MMSGPQETTSRVFSYHGVAVRVRSNQPASLEWLCEFFHPHASTETEGPARYEVNLIVDTDRFKQWSCGRPTGASADVFVLDSRVIQLPEWRAPDGAVAYYDRQYDVFYIVDRPGERYTLLAHEANLTFTRTPLMRAVRELISSHLRLDEALFLHSACAVFDGDGIVIAGTKCAGKTTLLMYLLTRGNGALLSNDRIMIGKNGAGWAAHAMPTVTSVRTPSFEFLEDIRDRAYAMSFHFRRTLRENEATPCERYDDLVGTHYTFSPVQFARMLEVDVVTTATPRAVVFPEITGLPGTIELELMPSERLLDAFMDVRFGRRDWHGFSRVFTPDPSPKEPDDAAAAALCELFAKEVPAYRCRLGLDVYKTAESAETLKRLVAGEVATRRGD